MNERQLKDPSMRTHNTNIYHCICCGRVVHAELEADPPQCCGHTMTKACAEAILDGSDVGEAAGGYSETAPPVINDRKKPR